MRHEASPEPRLPPGGWSFEIRRRRCGFGKDFSVWPHVVRCGFFYVAWMPGEVVTTAKDLWDALAQARTALASKVKRSRHAGAAGQ